MGVTAIKPGILDTTLDRVAMQIEKEMKIKRRVKGAMVYPTVVLVFAVLVLIGMLMFLVPVFQGIFSDLGGDLPFLTKMVVAASSTKRDVSSPGSVNAAPSALMRPVVTSPAKNA